MSNRNSFWIRTFNEARHTGDWVCVPRLYTRSTAAQLASDICNAHRRQPHTVRVRGIAPGEQWEAYWSPAEQGPAGDHLVYVRLLPMTGFSTQEA